MTEPERWTRRRLASWSAAVAFAVACLAGGLYLHVAFIRWAVSGMCD